MAGTRLPPEDLSNLNYCLRMIFGVVSSKSRNDRGGDECQGHGHGAGCCTAVSEPLFSGIPSVGSGMLSFVCSLTLQ